MTLQHMENKAAPHAFHRTPLGWDMVCQFDGMLLVVCLYNIECLPADFYADNPTDFYGEDYVEYKVKEVYVPVQDGDAWEQVGPQEAVDAFAAMYADEIEQVVIDTVVGRADEFVCPMSEGEPFYH